MTATCVCGHCPVSHWSTECEGAHCPCEGYRDAEAEQLRVRIAKLEAALRTIAESTYPNDWEPIDVAQEALK